MTNYEWKPTPEGSVLIHKVDYEQADKMPQTEETILGGLDTIGDYVCGFVLHSGVKHHLIRRFNPDFAMNDVVARLRQLGHEINYANAAEA